MTKPTPGQVNLEMPAPFLNCFHRSEAEALAALYVLLCREDGNTWKPQSAKKLSDFITNLGTSMPHWLSDFFLLGLHFDEDPLVKGEFFVVNQPDQSDPGSRTFEPTDRFFMRLAERGYIAELDIT